MREFKYVVTDPEGIHARPAGELVKAVKAFSSDIKIAKGGKAMNCKAIFGVMGLAVKKGAGKQTPFTRCLQAPGITVTPSMW